MDLSHLMQRLDSIDQRLSRIEQRLEEVDTLREALQHERDSRGALAEQTTWLIETLGEARKEVRWLRSKEAKES